MQTDLFGNELIQTTERKKSKDYDAFVEKFNPKKTTDDCYTPEPVFECIKSFVSEHYFQLNDLNIVRPFYPGGDYMNQDYAPNDIVFDNPPFSILASIIKNYMRMGVKFFLFSPHLTCFSKKIEGVTFIVSNAKITYHNGAKVPTDFVTNMLPDYRIIADGRLNKAIEDCQKKNTKKLPKYKFPDNVVTAARLGTYIADRGAVFKIRNEECCPISKLDSMGGKTIFGGAFLISNKKVQELKEAEQNAEAAKVAKSAKEKYNLSARERLMIANLK